MRICVVPKSEHVVSLYLLDPPIHQHHYIFEIPKTEGQYQKLYLLLAQGKVVWVQIDFFEHCKEQLARRYVVSVGCQEHSWES